MWCAPAQDAKLKSTLSSTRYSSIRTLKNPTLYDDREVLKYQGKGYKSTFLGRVLKSPELTPEAFFMHQTMTKVTFLELD